MCEEVYCTPRKPLNQKRSQKRKNQPKESQTESHPLKSESQGEEAQSSTTEGLPALFLKRFKARPVKPHRCGAREKTKGKAGEHFPLEFWPVALYLR